MNLPKFNNKKLFEQVFTHRSYLNESDADVDSNERLEFLGDSILSFIVSSYIFEKHKDLEEGQLTNIRSVLTNTETLYETSRDLGLGSMLKLSKGEEQSRGRENKTILANTLEALIGGLFLDQGMGQTSEFVKETILSKAEAIIESQGLKDPKSKLQERLQEAYKISPVYKIIKEEGPDHSKLYTVGVYSGAKMLAQGSGKSKQEAEKAAARLALETMRS
jgi:ribonuclease-3